MREAEERVIWKKLISDFRLDPLTASLNDESDLHLDAPCTILGGLNGSGKSRILLELESAAGSDALHIDLPHLCEQIKTILRSRPDADETTGEVSSGGPSDDRVDDVQRILRRSYSSVEWFSLEIEPTDPVVAARLKWSGDQPAIPYFRATHRGLTYSSLDM